MEEEEEYLRDLAFLHYEMDKREEEEYEYWKKSLQKPAKIEITIEKHDKIRVES